MADSLKNDASKMADKHPASKGSTATSGVEKIGSGVGRFLSNFSYVLGTLGFYLLLGVVTFLWLAFDLDCNRAATIAYDVTTGGNPLEYVDELQIRFPVLWSWIVIFHIFSWLVVPVLAATAIDAAYRKWEERKTEAERRLRKRFRELGRDHYQLSGPQLEEFVDDLVEAVRQLSKTSSLV